MASNITLSFLGFINLFMVPIIGLKLYCERHTMKLALTSKVTYLYVLITILNIPLTRVLVNITEALTSTTIYVETAKYTVITLISCVLLPYIMEIIETFIQVKVEISLRKFEKKHNKIKTNSAVLEESNEE